MFRNIITAIALIAVSVSCIENKIIDEVAIKPTINFSYTDDTSRFIVDASESYSHYGENLAFKWKTSTEGIYIENREESKAYFKLPISNNTESVNIFLTVYDSKSSTEEAFTIKLPENNFARKWNLGTHVKKNISNNKNYDWYSDQFTSGNHYKINCGPACATMAIKWSNKNFFKTVQEARQTYKPHGGWWTTNDVFNYLEKFNVNYTWTEINSVTSLTRFIDESKICILCLDMHYIREINNKDNSIDKFYATNNKEWGHFIILKGYKVINSNIIFECYDPYSLSLRHSNGTLKGIDRHYRSSDLDMAITNWWKYAIIVSDQKSENKNNNFSRPPIER